MPVKREIVQTMNPITKRYVKIDKTAGKIVSHKRTKGPYKDIPIVGSRESAS